MIGRTWVKDVKSAISAKSVSVGAVAAGLAVWAGPQLWRLVKGSSWNEDIEAVYGKAAGRTPQERTRDAGVIGHLATGGGGH